jgi:GT2 family glycosyltransferase
MDKIFISIISCKEEFLKQTIDSAINNAKYPQNICIGVLNTTFDDSVYEDHRPNVIVNNLHVKSLPGVGISRMYAINMCPDDADFILQVDAHMIFVKNWDEEIIDSFKDLEKDYEKLIISGMLFNWKKEKDKIYLLNIKSIEDESFDPNNMPNNEYFSKTNPYGPMVSLGTIKNSLDHGYPITYGYDIDWGNKKYLEIRGVTGPFVFARKKMFMEIQHDPKCVWAADEGIFSMRAWTRGYKIFAISKLILFHLDKGVTKSKIDWRDEANENFQDITMAKSLGRVRRFYLGNEFGYWGAPNKKLLKKYYKFIKFDFKKFYKELEVYSSNWLKD